MKTLNKSSKKNRVVVGSTALLTIAAGLGLTSVVAPAAQATSVPAAITPVSVVLKNYDAVKAFCSNDMNNLGYRIQKQMQDEKGEYPPPLTTRENCFSLFGIPEQKIPKPQPEDPFNVNGGSQYVQCEVRWGHTYTQTADKMHTAGRGIVHKKVVEECKTAYPKQKPLAPPIKIDDPDSTLPYADHLPAVGEARVDCGSAIAHTSPQGEVKSSAWTRSPFSCVNIYGISPYTFTGPMDVTTSFGYKAAEFGAGGDGKTPPSWGRNGDTPMDVAPPFLGETSASEDVPDAGYYFGIRAPGEFSTKSAHRNPSGTFTKPTQAGSVIAQEISKVSMKFDNPSIMDKNVCKGWASNSPYLRCETTSAMNFTPGVGLAKNDNDARATAVGGAVGWGVWPTTIRVLNYLPTTLTATSGHGASNFLVDPAGSKNIDVSDPGGAKNKAKIPAAADGAQFPTGMGEMVIGGYRSNTEQSQWIKKYTSDSTDATLQGIILTLNVKMLPGDNLVPTSDTPTPETTTPTPSPSSSSTWVSPAPDFCKVDQRSTQKAKCLVTVSGGMHKVVTVHLLPWGGNATPGGW